MTGKAAVDKSQVPSSHSLLDALEPDEWAKIAAFARSEFYKADEAIFRRGDQGHSMMTVVRGRIKISSSSAEGKEVVLAILGQGEVLGEMAVLEEKPRSADATALEASELMVVHRRDFIPFLERNPTICIRLLGILSARLRRTSALVADRRFLNFPSRLAKLLLDLALADGHEMTDGMRIDFKMSQKTVGALLGASRESVNKQLAAWQSEGLIKIARGSIVLTQPEELARIVEV